ncbi:FG-GAP repeat protein, partial [Salmonella enterica]|uniref:FG-GAP repeat protein n=1 Tax=Salmonella enterica TaxID=28901 RepID=UPI0016545C1A
PEGWGCTTKGVCREPSGEFSKALGAVSGGASTLLVGDFDGDGRRDLVGAGPRNSRNTSRVRVHYFDDFGGLAQ